MKKTIGLISDTHGVIKEGVIKALKNCDLIIHAGDIGSINVIDSLRKIAPVYAIRGNIDKGEWAKQISKTKIIKVDNIVIYVIHNIKEMDIDPKKAGFDIVVYGHSHKHSKHMEDDILYINPGGSGRKRFSLPLTVALLHIHEDEKKVEFIDLENIKR